MSISSLASLPSLFKHKYTTASFGISTSETEDMSINSLTFLSSAYSAMVVAGTSRMSPQRVLMLENVSEGSTCRKIVVPFRFNRMCIMASRCELVQR
eukprot:CAMPEP_0118971356 /NCGR_PEP_ID=MMETSP1173-20130426/8008_1 /TAXON_ID=1034831 /ORGANISM="Rhizochromulina marina cf, Strain CCMP1243" /LENGTH=96 /DNA_ID=CAMNT_0006920801 /DNA_START=294 /DNA_END=580 /DNA_ORIENTATION=+